MLKIGRGVSQVADQDFDIRRIILRGDFRQILPVIKNGCRSTIVQETIKYSDIWPLININYLKKSIRSNNKEFAFFIRYWRGNN